MRTPATGCVVASVALLAPAMMAQPEQPEATLSGHVCLPDGVTPASGARVFAEMLKAADQAGRAGPVETVPQEVVFLGAASALPVREDGGFEIPLGTPVAEAQGQWVVEADLEGYPPVRSEPVAAGGVVEITLSAGQPLRGAVAGPEGKPVAGVRVTAYWPNYRGGGSLGPDDQPRFGEVVRAETSEDGTYELGPLAPGLYDVWVTGPPQMAPEGLCDVAVPEDTPAEADLELPAPAAVQGKVTRPGTGEPVGGVELEVVLWDARDRRTATSAADGTYRIEGLPAGEHRIHLASAGMQTLVMQPWPATAAVQPGDVVEQLIEVCTGGTIEGQAVGADGKPVAGAWVFLTGPLWLDDGTFVEQSQRILGQTDAQGHFQTERLWPGEYGFEFTLPDGRKVEVPRMALEDGQTVDDLQVTVEP